MKTNLFLLIAFSFFLSSCQKEVIKKTETLLQSTPVSKSLQNWYNKAMQNESSVALNSLGSNTPDWNTLIKADKYFIAKINSKNSDKVSKYIVVESENNGNFLNGFIYVVQSLSLSKPINILLKEINNEKQSNDFKGAVLKYDLNNNKKGSSKYLYGIKENVSLRIETKENKKNASKSSGYDLNSAVNPANCYATGGVLDCEDYYLITYDTVTGEILNVEFLYTECVCVPGNGGGGSGGGGNNPPTCQQQNEAFVNQGHAVSGVVTENTNYLNGDDWNKGYNWAIFTAGTWGLISYEQGTLKKIHYPNNISLWEYQGFQHLAVLPTGTSIGGTRSFAIVPPIINISQSKTSANIHIDYTVSSKATCIPGDPIAIPYNSNKSFYAPNNFAIVPQ